jgi:Flp pilus assembly secretin CpaC
LTKTGAAVDGSRGTATQITSAGGFRFPALARETEGLNLTLQGILTGTQVETILHLLEEKAKTKTLSAPRVTTLNNQTATIRVVDEFNFPTRFEVSLIQFDINGDGDFDDAREGFPEAGRRDPPQRDAERREGPQDGHARPRP